MWLPSGEIDKTWNPFDCDRFCGFRGENTGERALRGCTRADLPAVEWDVEAERIGFYHGRSRDHERPGLGTAERPSELPENGCPGGYQRARLLGSLSRFYRRRTDDGNRVASPFFDKCDDWLVHTAVMYLEREEERCINDQERVWSEQRAAEAKKHG